MLVNVTTMRNWRVEATDGDVGSVADVFFDDERWGARYLVVETGGWLASRKVLLSPASVSREWQAPGTLKVNLTRKQIEQSPDVDTDMPVSRHYEIAHALHYGYPSYWAGDMLWGAGIYPGVVPVGELGSTRQPREIVETEAEAAKEEAAAAQSHLGSSLEMIGYRVEASDGEVAGDLEDLAIDTETWAIRHLVVDAARWWPGGLVHVDPSAVTDVNWRDGALRLRLTREQLKNMPAGE
jgi:sporulation protein YlmC with PRC-barrel domain